MQRCKPFELVSPDDIEGQQHVAQPRIGHHFGFAELLHSDAAGAQIGLVAGEARNLVRLDRVGWLCQVLRSGPASA